MARTVPRSLIAALVFLAPAAVVAESEAIRTGPWRAWLDSPGGELPFELTIEHRDGDWNAAIHNGGERIAIDTIAVSDGNVRFEFPHYEAALTARVTDGGGRIDGTWKKRGRDGSWTTLPFHAVAGSLPRFAVKSTVGAPDGAKPAGGAIDVSGRWRAQFSKSEAPAIGVFEQSTDGTVTGTFLTTAGDYRFLSGIVHGRRLRLSAFDGAHAFLFHATLGDDGTLCGDFWSRDVWHETWTAERNDDAKLGDAFALTQWNRDADLSTITVLDLDGRPRSLASLVAGGRCKIIEVFGTWCPNCHDAAGLLAELDRAHRDDGLVVVGVAFEYEGDVNRSIRQVQRFAKRHRIDFPLFVGGVADRSKADTLFPLIDRIRAYPTTIILNGANEVTSIHTGFTGPATGGEYDSLREKLHTAVQQALHDASR